MPGHSDHTSPPLDVTTLRGRVSAVVLIAVLLVALISAFVIQSLMRHRLDAAMEAKGLAIASAFSATATDYVLLDARLQLSEHMRLTMDSQPDIVYIFVADDTGAPVVSTFDQGVPPSILDANVPAPDADYGLQRLHTRPGRVLDVAVPMLAGDAGVAHIGLSEADTDAAMTQTGWALAGMTAAVLAIGALISSGGARIIVRPLESLATTATRVGAGDLSVRADVGDGREVAQVADAFNRMLDALQEDIRRREAVEADLERSRDELEERVAARTEELADVNEELVASNEEMTAANEELTAVNEELAALNEELAVTNEKLEAANVTIAEASRAKGDFLAAMSHELRTPLNSVIGFSDIMLREMAGPLTSEQRRQLEMVRSSGSHLLTLINDVLDLARIDRGHLEPVLSVVDLRIVAERAYSAFHAIGEAKGLSMLYSASEESCELYTDAVRVEQVLVNLLGNAVKFTDDGEIELGIGRTADAVEITVRDTGRGIPTDEIPRVFEEFYQVRVPDSTGVGGTGLGLAISKRIADALGAGLSVRSEPGTGSVFTLRMPLDGAGPHG